MNEIPISIIYRGSVVSVFYEITIEEFEAIVVRFASAVIDMASL